MTITASFISDRTMSRSRRLPIWKIVNVDVISQDETPRDHEVFDHGAAKKFVIDPHDMVAA